ncbi:hypothetical protein HPS54_04900 [Prevotella sp. PCHR]|uniref:Uncharacterized protein n=1 Tax=Xylanibacter caecicola TaxID=2736294 RepID=A0ABX2B431_9BACT|nr:hypothetical protein [Xylanibacter caecicola]NPE24859.1 hypothetical protein [Xylanibacter caecicola]
MNKKKYIKPEVAVVKIDLESTLMQMSQNKDGYEGGNPDTKDEWEGGFETKENNNSGEIWGDEW